MTLVISNTTELGTPHAKFMDCSEWKQIYGEEIREEIPNLYRYKHGMLGVPVEGSSIMLGDNISLIPNCSIPPSQLKKKHKTVAYHRILECVAGSVIKLEHAISGDNLADL